MKRTLWQLALIAVVGLAVWCGQAWAQGAAAPAGGGGAGAPVAAPAGDAGATQVQANTTESSTNLKEIIFRAGTFGVIIWLTLLLSSFVFVALVVDSFITIRKDKIAPPALVDSVRAAIEQGDLALAIEQCELSVTPLGRILKAGFSNVEEGFEVVQDAVGVAADMESDTLLARVSYLSVISNITPMLGLIGTVQGMIMAFATIGTATPGAKTSAMLALNISHGLWATAIGLGISVPAALFFYFFKNRTTSNILGMEALTLEVIKSLRNVEVVGNDAEAAAEE